MAPNNQHEAIQAQTGGHLPADPGDTVVGMTLSAIGGESWEGGTLSSLRKVGDNRSGGGTMRRRTLGGDFDSLSSLSSNAGFLFHWLVAVIPSVEM